MSGIAIHTASPINPTTTASKPNGVTPKTATVDDISSTRPAPTPTTTMAAMVDTYPRAQPGASLPAPTAAPVSPYPQLAPTRTVTRSRASSIASERYTPTSSGTPPPPQPGAVPFPLQTITNRRPSIPPPPKVGEEVKPPSYYAPQYPTPTAAPTLPSPAPLPSHQRAQSLHTPIRAQPVSSTTTSPFPPFGGTTIDLTGPPGYSQDSRASFEDRPVEAVTAFPSIASSNNSTNGNGLLGGNVGISAFSPATGGAVGWSEEKEGLAGVWDTAVTWAKKAGEKLQEGEEEIWRRVNGKS